MTEAIRISPEEAHERVASGKALLICAYADDAKFEKYQLEGAISLSSFKKKLGACRKIKNSFFTETEKLNTVLPVWQPNTVCRDLRMQRHY